MLDTINLKKMWLLEHEAEAVDTLLRMSMSHPENGVFEITPATVPQMHPPRAASTMSNDKGNEKLTVNNNCEKKSLSLRTRRVHWASDVVDSTDSSALRKRISKQRERRNRAAKDKTLLRGKPKRASPRHRKRQALKKAKKSIRRLNKTAAMLASSSSEDEAFSSDDAQNDEEIARGLMKNLRSKVTPFWDFDYKKRPNWYMKHFGDLDMYIADTNAKVTYLEGQMQHIMAVHDGITKTKPVITLRQLIFVTTILQDHVNYMIQHYL